MGNRKQNKVDSSTAVTVKDVDLRLIPEFDGTSQPVSEWLEKTELVCDLQGVTELKNVIPLRLTGGAFSVYQQLTVEQKQDYREIKKALTSAFAVDKFQAYDQFVSRKLRKDEAVDVYLAELRRLAGLFGGMSDEALGCAFVAGLPQSTRQAMRAGARIEQMTLLQLLSRARALLVDVSTGAVAAVAAGSHHKRRVREEDGADASVVCYACGQGNHLARDCLSKPENRDGYARGPRKTRPRCFRCHRLGHTATTCTENGRGEVDTALVSSPVPQ